MNARFLHRAARGGNAAGAAPDDAITREALPVLVDRACCCPARPAVRIVMPASEARRHETDLLLCGHHYRASRDSLTAAGAAVHEFSR